MNSLVVYDSIFGNTEKIARAIGTRLEALGQVRVLKAADASRPDIENGDLLVVGGPTHRHGVSQDMQEFLDRTGRGTLRGVSAAAFDTRYTGTRWITGSAAVKIARVLKKGGAQLAAEPESFFIEKDVPPKGQKRRHDLEHLQSGEEARARSWAQTISSVLAREPATVANR